MKLRKQGAQKLFLKINIQHIKKRHYPKKCVSSKYQG